MSTHKQGFQSFFKGFLHNFVLAKLATSSIRVNYSTLMENIKAPHRRHQSFPVG